MYTLARYACPSAATAARGEPVTTLTLHRIANDLPITPYARKTPKAKPKERRAMEVLFDALVHPVRVERWPRADTRPTHPPSAHWRHLPAENRFDFVRRESRLLERRTDRTKLLGGPFRVYEQVR